MRWSGLQFLFLLLLIFCLLREENIAEKKRAYFEIMGEEFPEKTGTSKEQKRANLKVQKNQATRKSPRVIPAATYKEVSLEPSKMKSINQAKKYESDEFSSNESSKQSNQNKCNLCSDSFKTATMLESHLTVAHVRVLYNCPICELPMFSKSNLSSHYKQNH